MYKYVKSSVEFPHLEQELKDALFDYMMAHGFEEDEVDEYSGVKVETTSECTKYTVYAELSYDGMMRLLEALDPIIQKYDSDAYFDMETSGRAVAYIYSESAKKQIEIDSDVDKYHMYLEVINDFLKKHHLQFIVDKYRSGDNYDYFFRVHDPALTIRCYAPATNSKYTGDFTVVLNGKRSGDFTDLSEMLDHVEKLTK